MNYKPYPDSFWSTIENCLKQLSPEQKIAAFDADGTLWDADLGENFFQYQIDHRLVDLPQNAFDYYLNKKNENGDPCGAFLWLAQINKNQSLSTVREWAQTAFSEIQPNPIFSEQKKLIQLLQKYDVQVYIVTASITWAVEAGAMAIGINPENVIGVETQVQNGIITEQGCYPITYKEGKVEALLKKTKNQVPFLCSGNSMGDFELLKAATHFKLAVSAASRDDHLFKTELELQNIAKEHNWFAHRFI